jgi:unsaturated rhamnogalacturonyl hydrolase
MKSTNIQGALERLAAHAAPELLEKQPHWGDAIQCDGLLAAAGALHDEEPARAAERWFAPKLTAGPRLSGWFWVWAAEAPPALALYRRTGRREYLDYARVIVDTFTSKALRAPGGAIVPHPPALEVWVDVAYFTAPAMAALAGIGGDGALLEAALDQVLAHQRALLNERSGLFWHVAYIGRQSHSACPWARGNSWYSIAATQILAHLGPGVAPAELGRKADAIRGCLARQLDAIIALQDPSGLWHTVIDRSDSYLESSASAGFALALGRALRMKLGGLDAARAGRAYERAIEAIAAKINPAGEFTGVSQQTPPGDFAFYNSIEVGTASFGTGVCLMALAELRAAP